MNYNVKKKTFTLLPEEWWMDNNIVGKIWDGLSFTNIYLHQFNIQSNFYGLKWDESPYIRTHTEEKVPKISNITFAILPLSDNDT